MIRQKIDAEFLQAIQEGDLENLDFDALSEFLKIYPRAEEIATLKTALAKRGYLNFADAMSAKRFGSLPCGKAEDFII